MRRSTYLHRGWMPQAFFLLVALPCWVGGAGQTAAQESATLEQPPAATLKTSDTEDAAKPDAKTQTEKKPEQEFMRVLEVDGKPKALQTAVAKYKRVGSDDGVEVSLIGAVHIAESTYYSELNQLFRGYDSLLFEMVMDPAGGMPDPEEQGVSPVSMIQVGMKDTLGLTFQLDEVDYKAENFVHADMTPKEFFECMESRKEGVMQMLLRSMGAGLAQQSTGKSNDIEVLAALLSQDKLALRRAFAEQMEMADGQMAALTGKDGKSVLITERNAKAFEVLQEQLDDGKEKIGVFYGAGHLKDMDKRLREEFGLELVEVKWLDAWNLK